MISINNNWILPSLVVLMFTFSWFICFSWLRLWLDGRRVTCPWRHMTMHCQRWVSDVGNREIASLINTLGCISCRHIVQTAAIFWHKHIQAHMQRLRCHFDRFWSTALIRELNLSLSPSFTGSIWSEGRRGSTGSTWPHCKYLCYYGNSVTANDQSASFASISNVTSGKFWTRHNQQVVNLMTSNVGTLVCDLIPHSLITLNESGLISKSVTISVIAFESYRSYAQRFKPVVIRDAKCTGDTVCVCVHSVKCTHNNAATVRVRESNQMHFSQNGHLGRTLMKPL